MLFNKNLQITELDVQTQESMNVLIEWRINIHNQIIDIKRQLQDAETDSELRRAKDAKFYMSQLINIVELRIKHLKRIQSQDVLLMRKFMKVAKKKLGGVAYQEILTEAKEIIGYKNLNGK